jgi:hypothetical protein
VDPFIRTQGLIREILGHACDRNQMVIVSTPYMRFETTFLHLEDTVVHCHANMDLEDAKYGLRSPDLKLRFPFSEHFYEGATRLLGLGQAKGRRSLQLTIPASLADGDYRQGYRVERVGRVPVTFSTRNYDLLTGTLVNISTGGLRLFLNRSYEEGELLLDDQIHVSFTLAGTIKINAKVKIRFVRDRVFGAEFRPGLDEDVLEPLSRWVAQRRSEDLAVLGRRFAEEAEPRAVSETAELILFSSSSELGEQLASALPGDLPPLRRVSPVIQSVRELGPGSRALALFHVDGTSWEARKRLRTLAEALPPVVPFVLIGTGMEPGLLAELGSDLKAEWTYPLGQNPGAIFPRLLRGIFRKHFPG